MALDDNWLAEVLTGLEYTVHRKPHVGTCFIEIQVADKSIYIRVELPKDFPAALPKFYLLEREKYGALAHVGWGKNADAEICFGSPEAFNVDYNNPDLIIRSSIERCLGILTRVLTDEEYNQNELKREFVSIWAQSHDRNSPRLLCIAEPAKEFESLVIRSEEPKEKGGVEAVRIAMAENNAVSSDNYWARSARSKYRHNEGKGILIEIQDLLPPPAPKQTIGEWWADQLNVLSSSDKQKFRSFARRTRAKAFSIICHSIQETGPVWFGIYGERSVKGPVPTHPDFISEWQLSTIILDVICKENLLPRAGSDTKLSSANVCLIGCGSVGGYIADLLASSGVGKLHLIDQDRFSVENSHRHYLHPLNTYYNKEAMLKHTINSKYPFVECTSEKTSLSSVVEELTGSNYDLIVCATGNMSLERHFNHQLHKSDCKIPVIYTFVEAFGVGGHAVASIASGDGCFNCIFINCETEEETLYPTISFIEQGQEIVRNHSGCGESYISYSNIDAVETASIASRLATRVLSGEIENSVCVSWRGPDALALKNNIKLTHRYHRSTKVLTEIPLANSNCEVCSDET